MTLPEPITRDLLLYLLINANSTPLAQINLSLARDWWHRFPSIVLYVIESVIVLHRSSRQEELRAPGFRSRVGQPLKVRVLGAPL